MTHITEAEIEERLAGIETVAPLVLPLKIDASYTRYDTKLTYFLNDQKGASIASTTDTRKVARWKQIVMLTELVAAGTDVKVEAVQFVVGVSLTTDEPVQA